MNNNQQAENRDIFLQIILLSTLLVAVSIICYRSERLDSLAYYSANTLYRNNLNPYDQQEMLTLQKRAESSSGEILSVWNPPTFFSTLGTCIYLSQSIAPYGFLFLSLISTMAISLSGFIIGHLYANQGEKRSVIYILYELFSKRILGGFQSLAIPLMSVPFMLELSIGQLTSWLAAIYLFGVVLFNYGYSLLAGIFLGIAINKPHVFFLPSLVLMLECVRKGNYRPVFGGLLYLIFSGVTAELIHPGIWIQWLTRESWPMNYYGSSIIGLIARTILDNPLSYHLPIAILSVVLGIAIILSLHLILKLDWQNTFLISWILNSMISPYGFVSDQVTLVVVIGYLIGKNSSAPGMLRQSERSLLLISTLHLFSWLFFPSLLLYWYLLPPLLLSLGLRDFAQNKKS